MSNSIYFLAAYSNSTNLVFTSGSSFSSRGILLGSKYFASSAEVEGYKTEPFKEDTAVLSWIPDSSFFYYYGFFEKEVSS